MTRMFGAAPSKLPQQIGFLLLPNFSMIAFSSAVEALRLANRTSGRALYGWTLITRDGQPVKASNGISFNPDASLDSAPPMEMLILCSGIGGHLYSDKAVFFGNEFDIPAGLTSNWVSAVFFRIECGKISEVWPVSDRLRQLRDLGVIREEELRSADGVATPAP